MLYDYSAVYEKVPLYMKFFDKVSVKLKGLGAEMTKPFKGKILGVTGGKVFANGGCNMLKSHTL